MLLLSLMSFSPQDTSLNSAQDYDFEFQKRRSYVWVAPCVVVSAPLPFSLPCFCVSLAAQREIHLYHMPCFVFSGIYLSYRRNELGLSEDDGAQCQFAQWSYKSCIVHRVLSCNQ